MTVVVDAPMIPMVQLATVELGLAFHVKTGFNLPGTSRRTSLTVARENGWTHKQTNSGALFDVIAFRRVLEPDYSPSEHVLSSFDWQDEARQKRSLAKVRRALKQADEFRARLDAWTPGEPQVQWTGVRV